MELNICALERLKRIAEDGARAAKPRGEKMEIAKKHSKTEEGLSHQTTINKLRY